MERFKRRRARAEPVATMCPEGGQGLVAAGGLFRGHPLHRRAEVEVGRLRVRIRPVLPTDADAVAAFFARLSLETAYRRFHAPLRRLSAAQLTGMVDVDHPDRETLVAFVEEAAGVWVLVAVAQYVRLDDTSADMAIAVGDRWQRRGIGRVLTAHLGRAAGEAGIAAFAATVLAGNPAPQRLARSVSDEVSVQRDGAEVELRIPLAPVRPFVAAQPG
jgi:GNAT superfamily N-acetyltransferase